MSSPASSLATADQLRQDVGPAFDYYFEQLRQADTPLVVKLGGAVLSHAQLGTTCATLGILDSLGLPMVLVHGGGAQIDTALEHANMTSEKVNGYRVTDTDVLGVVKATLPKLTHRVAKQLRSLGMNPQPLSTATLQAELKDSGDFGLVGDVIDVDTERISRSIVRGRIPILSCLGTAPNSHQHLNVNADDAGAAVAIALNAHKYAGLTKKGGLFNADDEVVPVITTSDRHSAIVDRMIADKTIHGGMLPKIYSAMRAVEQLDPSSSVVLTRPTSLLRELFTHQGEGTLVRQSDTIDYYQSLEGVDRRELRRVIESAFGNNRKLNAEYFDELPPDATAFVTAQLYNGVAIVFPGDRPDQPAYLDKIAVAPAAQGAGVGQELIDRALAQYPDGLFWRTRSDNTDNVRWYSQIADRQTRSGDWMVFGVNVPEPQFDDCVQQAVQHATTI